MSIPKLDFTAEITETYLHIHWFSRDSSSQINVVYSVSCGALLVNPALGTGQMPQLIQLSTSGSLMGYLRPLYS